MPFPLLAVAVLIAQLSTGDDVPVAQRRVARVVGDSPAAGVLVARLQRHGVALADAGEEPWLRVMIRAEGSVLHISLHDAEGRRAERTVGDIATAAALVESWLDIDMAVSPLLAPPSPPIVAEVPTRPPPPEMAHQGDPAPARTKADGALEAAASTAPPAGTATVPASAPTAAAGASLAAAIHTGYGTDRSGWMGMTLAAALPVHGVDVGAVFHLSSSVLHTPTPLYKEVPEATLDRRSAELLLMMGRPWDVGETRVSASAGAGMGWLHSVAQQEDHDGEARTFGPRLAASLAASWPRRMSFRFEWSASLTVAPLAHRAVISDDDFDIAGEPTWFVRTGLGLRYQVP